MTKQSDSVANAHEFLTRVISVLVELQYMQIALDLQDEDDKHKINLFGLNDLSINLQDININKNQTAKKIAIKLNEECYGCSDTARGQIYNAFKMACIDYQSTDVVFRGSVMPRKGMIVMKSQILDNEWKDVLSQQPFLG